jgi:hypothetical protein
MEGMNALETLVNDPLLYQAPLPYAGRYYPLGFPVDVAADAREVLEMAQQSWGVYPRRFDTPPLRVHVLTAAGGEGLPPAPALRGQRHLLLWIADRENFSVSDRVRRFAFCCVTRATLADPVFFRWHFLEAVTYTLLEQTCLTALHAACVARDGAGVLLHGESGMGKSTLSYACARRGWTYISDDASSLVWGGRGTVIGESHHFRFREEAPEIFPELRGRMAGRQLGGKPTIEVFTADLGIRTAPECRVERLVFLRREPGMGASLTRVASQEVRERLLSEMVSYDPELQEQRLQVIAEVAALPACELLYGSFEQAVLLLEQMMQQGAPA